MARTYATLDPAGKGSNVVLTNSNLTMGLSTGSWQSARANIGKSSGLAIFAFKKSITNLTLIDGVCDANFGLGSYLGASANSIGAYNSFIANGFTANYGPPAQTTGEVLYVLRIDDRRGWIAADGAYVGGGDPVANTLPTFIWANAGVVYPAGSASSAATTTFNAGQTAFDQADIVSALVAGGFDNGWFTGSDLAIPVILNTRRDL